MRLSTFLTAWLSVLPIGSAAIQMQQSPCVRQVVWGELRADEPQEASNNEFKMRLFDQVATTGWVVAYNAAQNVRINQVAPDNAVWLVIQVVPCLQPAIHREDGWKQFLRAVEAS